MRRLLAILLVMVAPSFAQAQESEPVKKSLFGWASKPYYWTLDHTAFGTVASDISTRAFGAKAVYGSVLEVNLGVNTFEVGAVSFGIGATGSDNDNPTAIGAQFGFVPACGPNRGLCLDVGLQKELNSNDNRYLILILTRLGELPEVLR